MKFPYSWLKELSKVSLSPQEAADRLTMLGLELESLTSLRADFSGVIVGHVLDVKKIEGSDHLKVCQVTTGSDQLQIVCGAPNVQAGQKVPVAVVGATLPGGLKIKKAKLRGVVSHGMICSGAELGISADASGIMVLNGNYTIGADFQQTLSNPEDAIIELAITPNRPDCLGLYGIARELCVSENKSFKKPSYSVESPRQQPEVYPIEIKAPAHCPRYTARIIRNIRIGPSPDWLVERLANAGMRSINNIVDITNYIMLATGQPLHAFDLDKLKNGKITVRLSEKDEEFMTLDGKLHKLTDENLLICDGELPVALAGVMGGENSEVDETTTNLLLESAYFSPAMIRKTAKKLGISTEASKRFERGTDPNGCAHASDAATSLICQYAQGEVASTLLDAYPQVVQQRKVPFRPQRANLVVGEEIPAETAHAILTNLGCTISQKSDQWDVLVPTFRPDLSREIDLIEEVARVFGYDNVAPTDSEKISLTAKRDLTVFHQNRLKNLATLATLSEVITFSFISEKHAQLFVESPASLVKLLNPLSEEMAVLRPMLFASMLPVISYNINRKHSDLRIFELGSVFQHRADSKHILESVHFAGLLTGMQNEHTWNSKPKASSFFDLKGILQAILDQANVADDLVFTEAKFPFFSYAATVRTTKDQIGVIGKIHPDVLAQFDIEKDVFAFELDFDKIAGFLRTDSTKYRAISQFPAVERDLAIVVSKKVAAAALMDCIKRAGGELLAELRLFDIYSGKQIPDEMKSLAFSLRFQSQMKTLTDTEVDTLFQKILTQLETEFQARLRQ